MAALASMPKYEAYKDSGIDWIDCIPEYWQLAPIRYLAKVQTGNTPSKAFSNYYSETRGVPWVKPDELNEFVEINSSKEKLTEKGAKEARFIPKGSTLVCCIGTIGKVGVAGCDLTTNQQINSITFGKKVLANFGKYVIYSSAFEHEKKANGNVVKILNSDSQKSILLPVPPLEEQAEIAIFLDIKTTKIEETITAKKKQIELLKERKQIIIQQAVTRGLNPDVPMKDSDVDWIGEIPEHWQIKRAKYLFNEIDERSENGDEELLSVSHLTGVTPRSEKSVTMIAEDYSGSKTCQKNDFVMNIMWAWMGAMGVSDRSGIVSSSYSIFRQTPLNIFNPVYLEWLLKTVGYIEHYNKVSTGLHSSRLRFYSRMFFDMEIGYPSRNEQDEIVTHIEKQSFKIDEAVELQKQQIEKLKEYKTTLINSAVTGKIKVPGVV